MSLGTPENNAIQKLSIIIIIYYLVTPLGRGGSFEVTLLVKRGGNLEVTSSVRERGQSGSNPLVRETGQS